MIELKYKNQIASQSVSTRLIVTVAAPPQEALRALPTAPRAALEQIAGSGAPPRATFLRAYRTGDGGYSFSPKQPWKPKNAINSSKKLVPSGGDAFALRGMLGGPPG